MKPTLLVLAAGIGSRFGGIKQMEKFGPSGETIIDYSIFDAKRAGFGKVIFVVNHAIEHDFRENILSKFQHKIPVELVFQEISYVPEGISITPERKKPWGTGHAVLMAANHISEPFVVINSDDFYGRDSFEMVARFLCEPKKSDAENYCMAGYKLKNTLSEFGSVSRGICTVGANAYLETITERTQILPVGEDIVFEEQGEQHLLKPDVTVSMNFFGFPASVMAHFKSYFDEFIRANSMQPKAEFYMPFVVNELIKKGEARLKVLDTHARWFGVTYQEDKAATRERILQLVKNGEYPANLWV